MTPERARELVNHTTHIKGMGEVHTTIAGTIRDHMTKEEIEFVTDFWEKLEGGSSFATALMRISIGQKM